MIRKCKKCLDEKDISFFVKKKKKSGEEYILYICKSCNKIYNKNYCISYYEENKASMIQSSKDWYKSNLDKKKSYDKQYIIENKDSKKEYDFIYRTLNKGKINKRLAQYYKNKRQNDPFFKLRKRISGSIWFYLKLNKSSKNGNSVINFLPFSIQELKEHLEKQFEPWMTWNNWGKFFAKTWNDNNPTTWTWHLDHIIPQSLLPYTSMEDDNFKKCWALNNLRPYSAKQNIIDSNKR